MPNPNPPPQLHPGNTGKETISQTPSSTTVDEPAAASAGTASVEDVQGDSSVADTSTSLQDIVSSIPADIQDPFETVCKHFVASLRHPFRLHDHIAVHLSDKLLLYITEKKFSEWPVADKASFLTALLPRKRMNEQLRPAAEKLVELAGKDENRYIKFLATMISPFIKSGCLSTEIISSLPEFKKFNADVDSKFTGPILTTLLPQEAIFLSEKSQRELIPSGIQSNPSVKFKDDFVLPTEEERYANYGVDLNDTPDSTPRSGTPPILTASAHRSRQPSSLFIPSATTLQQSNSLKSAPLRSAAGSRGGFKKEGKIKMLDFDAAEAAIDQRKVMENSLRAEKEAAREAKLREAEEKKLRRQAAEEERKLKAAERDAKKRKISGDFQETSQSSKQVRLEIDDQSGQISNQVSNQQSSATSADLPADQSQASIMNSKLPLAPNLNTTVSFQSTSAASDQIMNTQMIQVLDGGETNLSMHELDIISSFLNGRYEVQSGKKLEFKLKERVFTTDDNVIKRETLYLVLDYEICKWKKIKRTKKISGQV